MPARKKDAALAVGDRRAAEFSDFPHPIPHHVGPPPMFSVGRRAQDGEIWGRCDLCAKFVSGKDCTRCSRSKH
eukprot:8977743-Lingulodinium_polyedra.AAC.1